MQKYYKRVNDIILLFAQLDKEKRKIKKYFIKRKLYKEIKIFYEYLTINQSDNIYANKIYEFATTVEAIYRNSIHDIDLLNKYHIKIDHIKPNAFASSDVIKITYIDYEYDITYMIIQDITDEYTLTINTHFHTEKGDKDKSIEFVKGYIDKDQHSQFYNILLYIIKVYYELIKCKIKYA